MPECWHSFVEEIDQKSNMHFLHIPNIDKLVLYHSLDVIIFAGYRVKSKRGIEFRRWANTGVKDIGYEYHIVTRKVLEIQELWDLVYTHRN